jgi:hypothetical protein
MNKNKIVTLNRAEQYLAKAIAVARHAINRKGSVKNSKIGKQSDEFTDLEGIAGEIAFCKIMNVFPDTDIKITSSKNGEDKGDAITCYGVVDVKTTRYETGHLVVAPWKTGEGIDYYVLMVGTFPTYRYAGCISKSELISPNYFGTFNGQETYFVSQENLKDFRGVK